jgi:hypothetical protein
LGLFASQGGGRPFGRPGPIKQNRKKQTAFGRLFSFWGLHKAVYDFPHALDGFAHVALHGFCFLLVGITAHHHGHCAAHDGAGNQAGVEFGTGHGGFLLCIVVLFYCLQRGGKYQPFSGVNAASSRSLWKNHHFSPKKTYKPFSHVKIYAIMNSIAIVLFFMRNKF